MSVDKFILCYKYMKIDEGSLCVLTEGTLKYTCPLEFNDPFDCRPSFSKSALANIGHTRKELLDLAAKHMNLSPAQRLQKKKELVKKIENRVGKDEFMRSILSKIGVVSLTTDPANILMWSHYADFHRGFVAGFNIPLTGHYEDGLKGGYNLIPLEVTYSDDRPEIQYGIDSPHEMLQKMVFTKAKAWGYEKEHRVIEQTRGPGIHTYNRGGLLSSVIAGMNIGNKDFNDLRSIVQKLREIPELARLQLFKAHPSEREYALDIKLAAD